MHAIRQSSLNTLNLKQPKDTLVSDKDELVGDFMQQTCAELADAVVFPSDWLARAVQEDGWNLPKASTFVVPNLLPDYLLERHIPHDPTKHNITEVIFLSGCSPVELKFPNGSPRLFPIACFLWTFVCLERNRNICRCHHHVSRKAYSSRSYHISWQVPGDKWQIRGGLDSSTTQ